MTKPKDFEIYKCGMLSMSICTSLGIEEALKFADMENPTGVSHGWSVSDESKFRIMNGVEVDDGPPNPCPCEQNPDTHKHYLLTC